MEYREIIILNDEDGGKAEFEVLDRIVYQDAVYAVLLSRDEEEGIAILRAGEDDQFEEVEDEVILDAVFDLFRSRHEGEFEFEE